MVSANLVASTTCDRARSFSADELESAPCSESRCDDVLASSAARESARALLLLSVHAAVPARQLPGRQLTQEYGVGDFRRSFRLGDGFDASQISAEYRRGVLTISVPRLAAVRPRKVPVSGT